MASMNTLGRHYIVEFWEADYDRLNDARGIEKALVKAVEKGNCTLVSVKTHEFSPHGVTGVAVLLESHISIHTWPEFGYAAIDIFMCGKGEPELALESLKKDIQPGKIKIEKIKRGIPEVENDAMREIVISANGRGCKSGV